ncbi:hypothetical protein COS54_02225 [Candidatus Shapirobacteria bacterium CG03_land_8_20_14_0_80_39_12]|uniref:Homing endonuclease LAGLIDADG domain-containing protein n=1 Tax=Candidatus Shapirobacteria bacterium CG03_land_8_20_14_0_80_39_12 TaxID=1974879 RepID=A0A2M7BCS3_9BACT|nr:MAG: hypothetical protein COS54_02225 [Candidatus Shapirobacteria bacterium CG03_land_8_20_14_0_80_39_12]
MNVLSPTQKAWLAGFIDGEGFIGITFQRKKENKIQSASPLYHPYLVVTNTNQNSIQYIQNLVGDGKVYKFKARNHLCSPAFQYKLTKGEVLLGLLKGIEPFFVVKKEQSSLVIEYLNLRRERVIITGGGSRGKTSFSLEEEDIYQKLLSLNKRGERIKNGVTSS